MERLFSEYTRFNADANRTTEGTGIGLNITQSLVSMMDGRIEVSSEYGRGSIFTVTVKQQAVECEPIGKELSERLRNFTFTGEKQIVDIHIIRDVMPYGKVLVVDDLETNLYVAEGLMAPYELQIETALSGFEAISKIEAGLAYDIIFMDHMMPKMDGIETTQRLRVMGYKGTIVALTANAIVGNDEIFRQNGFDGFIAKPVDVRELNTVLNKFVRDKNPIAAKAASEAKKYKLPRENNESTPAVRNPRLVEVFCSDARKAIITLLETAESGDIKLFTITAHAMRSALYNVGEPEKAKLAGALENAGKRGDTEFINDNTEDFVEMLEMLIQNLKPQEVMITESEEEDTAFLAEQLSVIKAACGDYNDATILGAIDLLKTKPLKTETNAMLDKIWEKIYFNSDFDGVIELIEKGE